MWNYWIDEIIPHWHACVTGPIPGGGLAVDRIIYKEPYDAEDAVWRIVETVCEELGYEYDRDEWLLSHLVMLNCN